MILTVSRQYGSDGETIARAAAQTLGLTVVDREMIRAAALSAGIPAEQLQRLLYSGERSAADEIIQGLGSVAPEVAASAAANPLLGVFSPPVSADIVSLEEAARAVGEIIKRIAVPGNVLILGQGGQALFQGQPHTCHVLFVAPFDTRVARVAEWHKLRLAEARRRVRSRDEYRRDYLGRYHNAKWLDPLLYDLVINTARVSEADAVAVVVRAAQGADDRLLPNPPRAS